MPASRWQSSQRFEMLATSIQREGKSHLVRISLSPNTKFDRIWVNSAVICGGTTFSILFGLGWSLRIYQDSRGQQMRPNPKFIWLRNQEPATNHQSCRTPPRYLRIPYQQSFTCVHFVSLSSVANNMMELLTTEDNALCLHLRCQIAK